MLGMWQGLVLYECRLLQPALVVDSNGIIRLANLDVVPRCTSFLPMFVPSCTELVDRRPALVIASDGMTRRVRQCETWSCFTMAFVFYGTIDWRLSMVQTGWSGLSINSRF